MMNMNAMMTANQYARMNPDYAAMMSRRPAKKHRVFEIGNGIFFEYWNKDEWEFTLLNKEIDMCTFERIARQVCIDIKCINPTTEKLGRIVKLAKKRFAQIL